MRKELLPNNPQKVAQARRADLLTHYYAYEQGLKRARREGDDDAFARFDGERNEIRDILSRDYPQKGDRGPRVKHRT